MSLTLKDVRLSFPHLFVPQAFQGDSSNAKYQAEVIIKKDSENFKKIESEYKKVVEDALNSRKITRNQVTPLVRPMGGNRGLLIDCDSMPERYSPSIYGNSYVLRPKSSTRPLVCDRRNAVIVAEDNAIYGGVWANVNINIYAYSAVGGGITVGLNGVQKVRDDDYINGGRPSIVDMFGEPEMDTMFD